MNCGVEIIKSFLTDFQRNWVGTSNQTRRK